MVLSPENENLREQILTSALKILSTAVESKEGLATTASEEINSLLSIVQTLKNL